MTADWLPMLVWTAAALLLVAGLAGAVLPILPGGPLILAAAVLHKAFLPSYLSWWTVVILALLAAASMVMDAALAAAGGRRLGATAWGILGAGVGATVGMFFGPLGMLAGAVAGAVAAEVGLAGRALAPAARAGAGAALGLLASVAAKGITATAMILLFLFDCFLI